MQKRIHHLTYIQRLRDRDMDNGGELRNGQIQKKRSSSQMFGKNCCDLSIYTMLPLSPSHYS